MCVCVCVWLCVSSCTQIEFPAAGCATAFNAHAHPSRKCCYASKCVRHNTRAQTHTRTKKTADASAVLFYIAMPRAPVLVRRPLSSACSVISVLKQPHSRLLLLYTRAYIWRKLAKCATSTLDQYHSGSGSRDQLAHTRACHHSLGSCCATYMRIQPRPHHMPYVLRVESNPLSSTPGGTRSPSRLMPYFFLGAVAGHAAARHARRRVLVTATIPPVLL